MTLHDPQNLLNLKKMRSCADELYSLGSDTEPEFLNIGEMLNQLANICFGMTDDALKLTSVSNFSVEEEMSEGDSFIEETKKIFDEVADQVKNSVNSLNEGEYLLVDLLSQIKKLRQPIEGLHTIGKTFRVLGISIKVESSRNQNATQGFMLLAEEVADIAASVQDNCRYCNDKTDLVERDIFSSKQALDSSNSAYDNSGEQAIVNILSTLDDVGTKSANVAAEIQERSTVMVQGISDVVMAMQFHDICRQQLENVSHALTEVSEKAQHISDESASEQREHTVLEVYGILSIQVAHLNSIFEQVLHARKQIETGLEKTMEQAQLQAKDARTLLEIEGHGGSKSIVVNLEKEIDNIVISLNKSLGMVKNAAEISREVYENVSEIGKFVNSIEEIAFDVKILAINAMVEALKTGDTGRTLIVLAKELSTLSRETRDGATSSIERLKSIMEGTEKQLEYSANLDKDRDEVDAMIERAKTVSGTIMSSMQEVNILAQKMDNANQSLASQITQLVPGIKFTETMGDIIDRNWQIISQTLEQIEEEYPQFLEKNSEVEQMLEKLTQQYVMDRERAIHAQVAGKNIDDSGSDDIDLFEDDGFELFDDDTSLDKQESDDAGEEEEFGGNVELF